MKRLAGVTAIEMVDNIEFDWDVDLYSDDDGQFLVSFRAASTETMKHYRKESRTFHRFADAYAEAQRLFAAYNFPGEKIESFRRQLEANFPEVRVL